MANLNANRFEDVCNYKDIFDIRYNNVQPIKIGCVKSLHPAEAQWIYEHKQFILTSTSVYQIVSDDYKYKIVYRKTGAQFCKRGRFYVGDADFIKNITDITLNQTA